MSGRTNERTKKRKQAKFARAMERESASTKELAVEKNIKCILFTRAHTNTHTQHSHSLGIVSDMILTFRLFGWMDVCMYALYTYLMTYACSVSVSMRVYRTYGVHGDRTNECQKIAGLLFFNRLSSTRWVFAR